MNRSFSYRYLLLLLCGLGALVIALVGTLDFFTFLRGYRHYREVAVQLAQKPGSAAEAIVVLTGDRVRIPIALGLLAAHPDRTLIISGTGKGTTLKDLLNSQGSANLAISTHWDRIVLEPRSSSTIENAVETARVAAEKNLSQFTLVTSDYHMTRALAAFAIYAPQLVITPYPVLYDPTASDRFLTLVKLGNEYSKWISFRILNALHPFEIQK